MAFSRDMLSRETTLPAQGGIRMKKRLLSLLFMLALCLGLLPATALAAGPNTVYVGGVALAGSSDGIVYATTNGKGEVVTEGASADNYNIKWDGSTLTLHDATIQKELYASDLPLSDIAGAAIGVINQSGDAGLTVQLEGNNKIEGVSTGIHVRSSGGNAALNITGNGTLVVNSIFPTIQVISIGGNAALSIENAKVTATSSYSNVVTVESNSSENSTLTVNGGGLIATAQSNNVSGIRLRGTGETGGSSPTVTVSNNAIVRANGSAGGITSDSSTGVQYGTGSDSTGGIVFDGTKGTVYGNVTLQDDLTINEGESLTIGKDASLAVPNGKTLTNNGTVTTTDGGTLTGNITNAPPSITTASPLPNGTVGESYTETTLAADNQPTSWTVTSGSLPDGLTLNESTGVISGTPTSAGTSTFTVTATNASGSDSKEFTITVNYQTTAITTQPTDQTVTEGQTATFTVIATGNDLDYQWQYSMDNGKTWNIIDNATSDSYTTAATTMSMDGIQYCCMVKGADGGKDKSNAATLTVKPVAVTGVTLDKTTLDLVAGNSATLKATVAPENATNKTVTWASSNTAIATVDTTGKVTAVAPGTATITATTEDGGKTATCTVTVTAKTYQIAVDKSTLDFGSMFVGNSVPGAQTVTITNKGNQTVTVILPASTYYNVTAVTGFTDKQATLAPGGTATFTVQPKTGLAAGTYQETLTVSGDNGVQAALLCKLTVTAKTYSLSIDPGAIGFGTAAVGYTQPAVREVTVKNTGNQTLTLTHPTAVNFEVGKLNQLTLAPGEKAVFTVRPKAGLGAGSYSETVVVKANSGTQVSVNLTFTVQNGTTATPVTESRTLHFNTMGGLPMDDVKFGLGAPVELWPYTPVRTGYLFQGWYADEALTQPVSTIVLVKDTTIYAKWAVDPAAQAASGSGSGSSGSGSGGSGSGSKATPTPSPSPTPEPTATPTPTPEPTATPEPTPEVTPAPEETDKGGFPILPVAAGVVVLAALAGGIVWFRRR